MINKCSYDHTNVLEFDLVNQVDSGRNLVNQVRQPGKPGLGEACKVVTQVVQTWCARLNVRLGFVTVIVILIN